MFNANACRNASACADSRHPAVFQPSADTYSWYITGSYCNGGNTSSEVTATMNTYIALACFLAVAHGSAIGGLGGLGGLGGYGLGYGYGAPILAAPAISTANLVKAAPIPVIKTAAIAPIVTAPVLRTVSVAAPISVGYGLGGYGLGGYGLGGYGLGGWGGLGGHGLGWGGLGWGGWGKH
uniref:Uncharacterized protein n=1 Tax=Heliothis virescens TaxID=7102 RepID=A0A2A4IXB4_HELVI